MTTNTRTLLIADAREKARTAADALRALLELDEREGEGSFLRDPTDDAIGALEEIETVLRIELEVGA